jgi:hypothetical protein
MAVGGAGRNVHVLPLKNAGTVNDVIPSTISVAGADGGEEGKMAGLGMT